MSGFRSSEVYMSGVEAYSVPLLIKSTFVRSLATRTNCAKSFVSLYLSPIIRLSPASYQHPFICNWVRQSTYWSTIIITRSHSWHWKPSPAGPSKHHVDVHCRHLLGDVMPVEDVYPVRPGRVATSDSQLGPRTLE